MKQSRQKILSLIPPLVQVNTPYPSTSFITGFLHSIGYEAAQDDLGLKLVLKLFSRAGLIQVRSHLENRMKHEKHVRKGSNARIKQ